MILKDTVILYEDTVIPVLWKMTNNSISKALEIFIFSKHILKVYVYYKSYFQLNF